MKSPEFYDGASPYYDADYEAAGLGDDVAFYVAEARAAGGPVLEMGCGTGRVLLPVARAGVEVVGVDSSPEMLSRLEEALSREPEAVRRRVRLVRGDVREVRVPGEFPLVTAPFRVIQHLVTRADQRAWLGNVARHLWRRPPGLLVFDSFQPDYGEIAASPTVSVDIEREDPETGRTVRRVSRSVHHPEHQTFDVGFQWLVEDEDGGERMAAEVETVARWFTRAELLSLLELEGFEVLDFWGDFARTPFGPGAEDQVVRARLGEGGLPTTASSSPAKQATVRGAPRQQSTPASGPHEAANESQPVARAPFARRGDAGVAGTTSRIRNAARGDPGTPAVGPETRSQGRKPPARLAR